MPQYHNNMHTSPNRPSPRGVDERSRRSTYYEDSDMFDATEGHGSHGSLTGVAVEVPISQPHYQQQQQQMVPVEQSRPPQANNLPVNRGQGGSRPPSYGNSSYEEALMTKPDAAEQRQQQQVQRRRGYRRTDESAQEQEQVPAPIQQPPRTRGQPNPAPRTSSLSDQSKNQNQPQAPPTAKAREQRASQPRAPEPPTATSPTHAQTNTINNLKAGTSIPRLNSPSVTQIVLQPLDAKVQEYGNQMLEEEKLMAQLDSEMAALQERRRAADDRFMAAKMKHDDYRRQYQGVERALRGEVGGLNVRPGGGNGGGRESVRSSCDDERPTTQQTMVQQQSNNVRPPNTSAGTSRTESWGSVQKPKSGRFRMSKIFGVV